MKITFNALGIIISTITNDEPLRQGNVGNTLKATFEDKLNTNYSASFTFTRSDNEVMANVVMLRDSDSHSYKYTFSNAWFFEKAGTTTLTIYLKQDGITIASGQVQFSIEESDVDGDITITPEQYDTLMDSITDIDNAKLDKHKGIQVVEDDDYNVNDYEVGDHLFMKYSRRIVVVKENYLGNKVIADANDYYYMGDASSLPEVDGISAYDNDITDFILRKNHNMKFAFDFTGEGEKVRCFYYAFDEDGDNYTYYCPEIETTTDLSLGTQTLSRIKLVFNIANDIFTLSRENILTAHTPTKITQLLNEKVDKTSENQKIYGTDNSGNQTLYEVSTIGQANKIAQRDADGQLNVKLEPTQNEHATSKKYVDDGLSEKVNKITSANKVYITDDLGVQSYAGYDDYADGNFVRRDVNDNHIYVPVIPTANSHATSKKYVDDSIASSISSVYRYKGSVATYDDLPSESQVVGDTYNVEDTGDNYSWNGTAWDKLAGVIDLSAYLTTSAFESAIANYYTTSQTDNTFAKKEGPLPEIKVLTQDSVASVISTYGIDGKTIVLNIQDRGGFQFIGCFVKHGDRVVFEFERIGGAERYYTHEDISLTGLTFEDIFETSTYRDDYALESDLITDYAKKIGELPHYDVNAIDNVLPFITNANVNAKPIILIISGTPYFATFSYRTDLNYLNFELEECDYGAPSKRFTGSISNPTNITFGDLYRPTYRNNYELESNKVTSISGSSTDTQYPSAKCVFDNIQNVREVAEGKCQSFVVDNTTVAITEGNFVADFYKRIDGTLISTYADFLTYVDEYNDCTNSQFTDSSGAVDIYGYFITTDNVIVKSSSLKTGDVIFVLQLNVPDRWYDDNTDYAYPLESKSNLSNYYTKTESDNKYTNQSVIASAYSNLSTYAVGDLVIYNNKLYKCITAVSVAEDFDSTKWVEVKIADEFARESQIIPQWYGTQAQYDALQTYDSNTIYNILES